MRRFAGPHQSPAVEPGPFALLGVRHVHNNLGLFPVAASLGGPRRPKVLLRWQAERCNGKWPTSVISRQPKSNLHSHHW